MDGEFEKTKDLVPQLECDTPAAKEHISKKAAPKDQGTHTVSNSNFTF